MSFAYVNGEYVESDKASISIFDRGLVLGDGFFETVKLSEGRLEFFEDHYLRLMNSAKKLLIPLQLGKAELQNIINTLSGKNALKDAVIRLTITRGIYKGGLGIDENAVPSIIITCRPLPENSEYYEWGVSVCFTNVSQLMASGIDGAIKSTNYLANIMAKHEADSRGYYEGIFKSEDDSITEMTTSSFFCVIDGVYCTPPLEEGILPGITRKKVIASLQKSGYEVAERKIHKSEVSDMEFAFLTSSIRGVVPITKIENQQIDLNQKYFQQVKKSFEEEKKLDMSSHL